MKKFSSLFDFIEDTPLTELNERYFAYAATLAAPLNTLALDRHIFMGNGESKQITSLREIYAEATCMPWLFVETFPTISEVDLLDIAEAEMLLIMAVALHDHYLDGQLSSRPGSLLLHLQLHTTALRKFQSLFEAKSPFWTYFDRYFDQYTAARLKEMEHWGRITAYSIETMWKIGRGKSALLKVAITALAIKAGAERYIPQLETALDAFVAAMQLGDDIGDWAEDYECQRYTLPVTQAIPIEHWPTPSLSVEKIGQQLENSIIIETLLKQVIEWFELALNTVIDLHCPRWIAFVEDRITSIKSCQRALVAAKLRKIITEEFPQLEISPAQLSRPSFS